MGKLSKPLVANIKKEKSNASNKDSPYVSSDSDCSDDSSEDSDISGPELKRRKKQNEPNLSNRIQIKTDIDDLPNTSTLPSPQLSSTQIVSKRNKKKISLTEKTNMMIAKMMSKFK